MICRSRFTLALVLVVAMTAFGTRTPAAATEASWSFLFDASSAGDDSQYFLNLAVTNAGYPRTVIEPLVPRLAVVDTDLPVVLFLARRCECPPERIVAFREQHLSWAIIFGRVGVPVDVLFTGLERDPGPPYGHAWGYWKKHGRRSRLADHDVVSLVELQTAHVVTGRPVVDIVRVRASGESAAWFVADARHRHQRKDDDNGDRGNGRGEGHGNGRHGHGGRR